MKRVAESRSDPCLHPNRGRRVLQEPHAAPCSIAEGDFPESAMDLPGHTTWVPDLALHSYRCSVPDCCPRESKMQTGQGQTTTLSTSDRGAGGGKKKSGEEFGGWGSSRTLDKGRLLVRRRIRG